MEVKRYNLKTNGVHSIKAYHKLGRSIIYCAGTFSTATAKLVVPDGEGGYDDLEDGALLVDTQSYTEHGLGMEVFVEIANADGSTNIRIAVAGIH